MGKIAKLAVGITLTLNIGPHSALADGLPPTCVSKNLQPIIDTHKFAPYPPRAVELNETGTTMMRVVIGKDGTPIDVSTIDTSGFEDLDTASIDWIKKTWRWNPIPTECPSIETRVNFKWSLTEIGRTFNLAVRLSAPKSDRSGAGASILEVLLSDTGEIVKIRLVTSSGDRDLDRKAEVVLRTHKFQPGLVDGHPATSTFMVQIDW